jgi:hypothetical protein
MVILSEIGRPVDVTAPRVERLVFSSLRLLVARRIGAGRTAALLSWKSLSKVI